MDIILAQLVPVPNPALEMKKRKSSKERESIFWRIISNLTFFNICSMKLAFRRKQESLLKKMYENTPQWRHSFFDKCEFWEGTLNLLVSQIFYCDILKPLALVLLWKMQDVWVLKSGWFFLCSGHVPYHIWCDSLNVTEEEPLHLCLTNSQTFVIVSPRSICMLANFSEAEF